jgi:hypothetical protein
MANIRLQRTVLNWKWWLLLPLMPIFVLLCLLYMALDTTQDQIRALIRWSKQP